MIASCKTPQERLQKSAYSDEINASLEDIQRSVNAQDANRKLRQPWRLRRSLLRAFLRIPRALDSTILIRLF